MSNAAATHALSYGRFAGRMTMNTAPGRSAHFRDEEDHAPSLESWPPVRPIRNDPLARVASLLLAISQINIYEGRDPSALPDALTSGFVADLLGLSVADLADLLVELQRRGLVAVTPPSGLRLTNTAALAQLAGVH